MNPEILKRIAALDMPAESLRELLVILADSAPVKESNPRSERNRRYYQKSREGLNSDGERLNSDGERLSSDDLKRLNSDGSSVLSPSPPPLSPTPPIPAPTPAGGSRERAREAEADFHAACSVDLDLTASPELRQAWREWQAYRQSRHKATGTAKLPWTAQAAKLSASQITRNADTHGTQIVTDRIASAIAGNWQGLNFDTLKTNGHPSNQPTSSRFPATSAAAAKVRPPDGNGRQKASSFDV